MSWSFDAATTLNILRKANLRPRTVEKLERLAEQVHDLEVTRGGIISSGNGIRARIDDARLTIQQIEERIRDVLPDQRDKSNAAAEQSIDEQRAVIAREQRAMERGDAAIRRANAIVQPLEELLQSAADWCVNSGQTITLYDGKLEVWSTDIEKVRREISRVRADIRRTLDAPRSSAELATILDREIDRLRQAGTPNLTHLIEGVSDEIRWPSHLDSIRSIGISGRDATVAVVGNIRLPRVPEVLAWMFPKAFRTELHKELASQLGEEGLGAEERASRLKELRAELLALERLEEHVIETQQPDTARRTDLDLRAFLDLADDVVVPVHDED